jgi:hypothetical protein
MKKNFIYFIYFYINKQLYNLAKRIIFRHYQVLIQAAQEQFLYISTPSITPVNFKINQLGAQSFWNCLTSSPYIFNAGSGTDSQLHVKRV